jgi:hypothetical protein
MLIVRGDAQVSPSERNSADTGEVWFDPILGIFVYLIARGGKMHERAAAQAAQQQKAFDAAVQQAAGTGTDSTEQLTKLAAPKGQGVITEAEFEAQKAKILA